MFPCFPVISWRLHQKNSVIVTVKQRGAIKTFYRVLNHFHGLRINYNA
jgi:hypothetical protein